MEPSQVVPRWRRSRVLTPARFGCLEGIPTLNITQGCLFQCAYCYARGYRQAPEKGKVHLFVNLPDLLRKELSRKRAVPSFVILNTASDCFQPHPDILQIAYEVMETLLDHGIGLSLLTKGVIPKRFLELFRKHPDRILVQIGLVSLSNHYWRNYEPGTPSPMERIKNIEGLKAIGIIPEVRIDPMIPFVTDTEAEARALFGKLKEAGVKRVTLSYLHLRPAIEKQLEEELSPLERRLVESFFRSRGWTEIGSSSQAKLLPKVLREKGYQRMKGLAQQFGIAASVCQCKNPDLSADLCGSSRVRTALRRKAPCQLPLFRC